MSSAAGKRADLAVQKAKKQKKIAIVGVVLLIGLMAFQLPRLMKHFHSSTNVVDTNLIATPPGPVPGATTPGSSAPAPAPAASSGKLPETDRVTVTPASGQLISFGLFKSKDPFVQQLSDNMTTPTATTPAASGTSTGKKKKAPPGTVPTGVSFPTIPTTTPASGGTTPATTTPAPTASTPVPTTPPGTVAIRIGGACQVVALHGTFPKGIDIFRVESIGTDGSIKISVNGGTYESGAETVTLKRGATLTLQNTADGARYVLRLVSSCPAAPGSGSTSTSTTTTSTTPTTTSTTTTPSPTSTTP